MLVRGSGASFHVTPWIGDLGHARIENDNRSNIAGKWDVFLETNIDCLITLKYVTHVPDMRISLILADILYKEGYTSVFEDMKLKLEKGPWW